jgi:hypothetical protein
VWVLGRLPFVGERLLAQLAAEALQQRPSDDGRTYGQPGDVLSRLSVSRQLREAVSAAFGARLVPTYEAVYQYQPPGSSVAPHRDTAGYDLTFHMTLEHARPGNGSQGSVLEVHGPEGCNRIPLARAESLLFRGRELVHGWTPLADDEQRTLVAIGFQPAGD